MYEIEGYEEWEARIPEAVRLDPLLRMRVYRLAVFLAERVGSDAQALSKDAALAGTADQLSRAVGSIGANLAEGYSRDSGRDRARFYGYALGSAREALHWYRVAASAFQSPASLGAQLEALVQVRRLLAVMIPRERKRDLAS